MACFSDRLSGSAERLEVAVQLELLAAQYRAQLAALQDRATANREARPAYRVRLAALPEQEPKAPGAYRAS
jgi:hypothetical protein